MRALGPAKRSFEPPGCLVVRLSTAEVRLQLTNLSTSLHDLFGLLERAAPHAEGAQLRAITAATVGVHLLREAGGVLAGAAVDSASALDRLPTHRLDSAGRALVDDARLAGSVQDPAALQGLARRILDLLTDAEAGATGGTVPPIEIYWDGWRVGSDFHPWAAPDATFGPHVVVRHIALIGHMPKPEHIADLGYGPTRKGAPRKGAAAKALERFRAESGRDRWRPRRDGGYDYLGEIVNRTGDTVNRTGDTYQA